VPFISCLHHIFSLTRLHRSKLCQKNFHPHCILSSHPQMKSPQLLSRNSLNSNYYFTWVSAHQQEHFHFCQTYFQLLFPYEYKTSFCSAQWKDVAAGKYCLFYLQWYFVIVKDAICWLVCCMYSLVWLVTFPLLLFLRNGHRIAKTISSLSTVGLQF